MLVLGLIFTIWSACFFTSTYPPLSIIHTHIAHTSACPAPTCFFSVLPFLCLLTVFISRMSPATPFFPTCDSAFSKTAGKLRAGRRLMTQIIETNEIWPQSDVLRGIKQQRKQVYIRHKTWPKSLNLESKGKSNRRDYALAEQLWIVSLDWCWRDKLINKWLKKT